MVATIIISVLLAGVVGLVIRSIIKRRKSSVGGCSCGCDGCAAARANSSAAGSCCGVSGVGDISQKNIDLGLDE
jgi:hypothetical protein